MGPRRGWPSQQEQVWVLDRAHACRSSFYVLALPRWAAMSWVVCTGSPWRSPEPAPRRLMRLSAPGSRPIAEQMEMPTAAAAGPPKRIQVHTAQLTAGMAQPPTGKVQLGLQVMHGGQFATGG